MAEPYSPFLAVLDYILPLVKAFAERVKGEVVVNRNPMRPSLTVDVPAKFRTRGSVYIGVNPWWAPHTVGISPSVPYETSHIGSASRPSGNIPLSYVRPFDLERLVTQLNGLESL